MNVQLYEIWAISIRIVVLISKLKHVEWSRWAKTNGNPQFCGRSKFYCFSSFLMFEAVVGRNVCSVGLSHSLREKKVFFHTCLETCTKLQRANWVKNMSRTHKCTIGSEVFKMAEKNRDINERPVRVAKCRILENIADLRADVIGKHRIIIREVSEDMQTSYCSV